MADNLGPMAWLFLQENVQVQYLQKIAQMRKKSIRPQIFNDTVEANFLHEVQFSAAIEAAHFLAETTRPLGRGCLHFHLLLKNREDSKA